jgi:hypothetical protein
MRWKSYWNLTDLEDQMGPGFNNLVSALNDGHLKSNLGIKPPWFIFYELLENSGFKEKWSPLVLGFTWNQKDICASRVSRERL